MPDIDLNFLARQMDQMHLQLGGIIMQLDRFADDLALIKADLSDMRDKVYPGFVKNRRPPLEDK